MQTDKTDTEKVNDIPCIDDALGYVLKMEIRAQISKNPQHGSRQKEKHLVDQGQNEADGHAHNKGDDLVAGQGRGKQSNRDTHAV